MQNLISLVILFVFAQKKHHITIDNMINNKYVPMLHSTTIPRWHDWEGSNQQTQLWPEGLDKELVLPGSQAQDESQHRSSAVLKTIR